MIFEAAATLIGKREDDVEGLEGSREHLDIFVVDDPPVDRDGERAPGGARRLQEAALVTGLADLAPPLHLAGRVEIEDAVPPLRAGDSEILGQVHLPPRTRGADVDVLLEPAPI